MQMTIRDTEFYFCFDGDRIGEQVACYFMSNEIEHALSFSDRVEKAMDAITSKMENLGAKCIFRGGDSLVFHSNFDIDDDSICVALDGISFSVGVGNSIQAASLSLFKAKALGRSQVKRMSQ